MMTRLHRLFRRTSDERGGTLVLVAAAMSILLPVALAFSVEIGEDTVVNRSLQTAADAGAVDGARFLNASPDNVSAIVGNAVSRNYPGTSYTVQQGSWTQAGGFVSSLTCEATSTCTAVKVTTSGSVKHIFQSGSSSLQKSAVAVLVSGTAPGCTSPCTPIPGESGFSIGSYLASVNSSQSPVLNSLLGALGTSVNLSAVGYQGLATTWITVQNLIDASGGVLTPSNVLNTSLTGAQWDSFLTTAVSNTVNNAGLNCSGSPVPAPCTAKASLTTLGGSINSSTSAKLCQLVSIDGSGCTSVLGQPALGSSLNVLQLLTTEAELANGSNALSVGTALNLGVASAALTVSLIQPAQVAFGPVGTSAATQQVSVDLKVTVAGIGVIDIPITGAEGTATLANISCSNNAMYSTTIDAATNALNANIAVAGLNVGTLKASAVPSTALNYNVSAPAASPYTSVPPSTTSISGGTNPQNIGSTSPTLSLSVTGLGLLNSVAQLALNPLTTSLAPVLQALGVNVGGAQVADLSTVCDPAQIVG